MTSLSSGIKGPCPSHVDDALVKHLQCDVEVGQRSHLVDQAHAHLGLGESLSEGCVVVEHWVNHVLEVTLAAQIQIFILGAAVDYIRDSAELKGVVQGLLVSVNSENLGSRVILLLELNDIAVLKVATDEICGCEVSRISDNDRVK